MGTRTRFPHPNSESREGHGDVAQQNACGRSDAVAAPPLPPLKSMAARVSCPEWTLTAALRQMATGIGRDLADVREGRDEALNRSSMSPPGLLRAGFRLRHTMSQCILEPRPPGKRWLVSGVERGREGNVEASGP